MSSENMDAKPKKQSAGFPTRAYAAAVFAVVCLAVVGVFLVLGPLTGGSGSTGSGRSKGNLDSKVEFIEWSDFQ